MMLLKILLFFLLGVVIGILIKVCYNTMRFKPTPVAPVATAEVTVNEEKIITDMVAMFQIGRAHV